MALTIALERRKRKAIANITYEEETKDRERAYTRVSLLTSMFSGLLLQIEG